MGGGQSPPPSRARSDNIAPSTSKKPCFPLRVLTHNIRYAATDLFKHEEPWAKRLPNLLRQLYHYTSLPFNPPSTIICLQEVLYEQLRDLNDALSENYSTKTRGTVQAAWNYVGVGRDDGKLEGEFNPIFYRPEFWEELHFETIWLSETPNKVSRGWDGGCNRLVSCLVLRSRKRATVGGTQRKVMILNTHLDNSGVVARRKGAALIIERTREWRKRFEPDHVVLTGDLNSSTDEEGGAWEVLNTKGSGFVDSRRLLLPEDDPCRTSEKFFGDENTFTGFDGKGDNDRVVVLDFVHLGLSDDEQLDEAREKAHGYAVVPNIFEDGVRCSDHRAVVVDFVF